MQFLTFCRSCCWYCCWKRCDHALATWWYSHCTDCHCHHYYDLSLCLSVSPPPPSPTLSQSIAPLSVSLCSPTHPLVPFSKVSLNTLSRRPLSLSSPISVSLAPPPPLSLSPPPLPLFLSPRSLPPPPSSIFLSPRSLSLSLAPPPPLPKSIFTTATCRRGGDRLLKRTGVMGRGRQKRYRRKSSTQAPVYHILRSGRLRARCAAQKHRYNPSCCSLLVEREREKTPSEFLPYRDSK